MKEQKKQGLRNTGLRAFFSFPFCSSFFSPSFKLTAFHSFFFHPSKQKRAQAANGGLLPPPEVLRALLAAPAGDLDDLLSHPSASAAAVARLTLEFDRGGTRALEAAHLPRLSWEEMREVQAWREGKGIENEEEEVKALEGGKEERAKELQQLPAPLPPSAAPACALNDDDDDDSAELDLDALDF